MTSTSTASPNPCVLDAERRVERSDAEYRNEPVSVFSRSHALRANAILDALRPS